MRSTPLLVLLACACTTPVVPQDFRAQYVLSHLTIDPVTEIGHLVSEGSLLATEFGLFLNNVNCDGAAPALVDLQTHGTLASASGTAYLLVTTVASGEPCAGGASFMAAPFTFGPDEMPLVSGPVFTEGLTAEARIPLRRANAAALWFLPEWWRVTASARQGSTVLGEGEATGVWAMQQLTEVPLTTDPDRTVLDAVILDFDAQPELDVDRDGLEQVIDANDDGHLDGCVDGDGEPIDGIECLRDPRMVDAYELGLRFRLVPAVLIEP